MAKKSKKNEQSLLNKVIIKFIFPSIIGIIVPAIAVPYISSQMTKDELRTKEKLNVYKNLNRKTIEIEKNLIELKEKLMDSVLVPSFELENTILSINNKRKDLWYFYDSELKLSGTEGICRNVKSLLQYITMEQTYSIERYIKKLKKVEYLIINVFHEDSSKYKDKSKLVIYIADNFNNSIFDDLVKQENEVYFKILWSISSEYMLRHNLIIKEVRKEFEYEDLPSIYNDILTESYHVRQSQQKNFFNNEINPWLLAHMRSMVMPTLKTSTVDEKRWNAYRYKVKKLFIIKLLDKHNLLEGPSNSL